MPIDDNQGGRLPRAFDGVETTLRQYDGRITTLERLHWAITGGTIEVGDPGSGINLWSGIGPPTLLIGKNGDFYIDYVNWVLYGPRTATVGWDNFIALGGTIPERRFVSIGGAVMDPMQSYFATTMLYRQERVVQIFVADELFELSTARIRAYMTIADRAADRDRGPMEDPYGDHGLCLEVLTDNLRLSPAAYLVSHRTALHGGDYIIPGSTIQPIYWNIECYNHEGNRLCVAQMYTTRAEQ